MSVVLARIDERLVHGQITVGWMEALGYDRILVADDDLATDDWERGMVESAAPPGVAVEVLPVAAAARRLQEGVSGRALVLVRSPVFMLALSRAGAPLAEVNVGGLHYREGSRRYLDYLYVTPRDIAALRALAGRGIRLVARDLPGHPGVELNAPLAEGRLEFDQLPPGGA